MLVQHGALESTQEELADGEIGTFGRHLRRVADRESHVHSSLQRNLFSSDSRPKTGLEPQRNQPSEMQTACVWRGSGETDFPPSQHSIMVWDTPLGEPVVVQTHLDRTAAKQRTFLERICVVADLQSSWLILLHCTSVRATCVLRMVEPQSVAACARAHDEGIWAYVCTTQERTVSEALQLPNKPRCNRWVSGKHQRQP